MSAIPWGSPPPPGPAIVTAPRKPTTTPTSATGVSLSSPTTRGASRTVTTGESAMSADATAPGTVSWPIYRSAWWAKMTNRPVTATASQSSRERTASCVCLSRAITSTSSPASAYRSPANSSGGHDSTPRSMATNDPPHNSATVTNSRGAVGSRLQRESRFIGSVPAKTILGNKLFENGPE